MKTIFSLILFLTVAIPALGQGVRIDPLPVTTVAGQPFPGMSYPPILAIPNASISICNYPSFGFPCINLANTYLDATLGGQCPSDSQVVLNGQATCQSTSDAQGNFGFWVAPGNYVYQITLQSGQTYGPFFVSAGSASAGGVTKLIPGVNCTVLPTSGIGNVVFNCTGGTGGGVGPGNKGNIPYYTITGSQIAGDPFLIDTAPGNPDSTKGSLTYNGPQGSTFQSTNGGAYVFSTNTHDSFSPTVNNSWIKITTELDRAEGGTLPSGQIDITTDDKGNNDNSSIINITALEEGSGVNAAIINITSSSPNSSTDHSGIINITATSQGSLGGNVNITAMGPGGGIITLAADPVFGEVHIIGGLLVMDTPNFTVDASGNVVSNLVITAKGGFQADDLIPGNCVQADSGKHLISASGPCGSGGGSGSGTGLTLTMWAGSGASTTLGNSHIDDGLSTPNVITATEPLTVADGTSTGGSASANEGTGITTQAGTDNLWASSTFHQWTMNNNGGANKVVVGTSTTPGTAGNCLKYDTNGFNVIDAGGPCLLSTSTTTPTLTIDSGAGSGGSLSVSLVSGGNDQRGWVNITTGNAPAASAGVVTVVYQGTYATAQKCLVEGSNTVTSALNGTGRLWVPQSTSTALHFVIQVGATALTANTTYQVGYSCGL